MERLLYLTSAGLNEHVRQPFLDELPKSPSELRVAFIPTAADPEEDTWFVDAARKELIELGFQVEDVDLKIDPEELKEKLEAVDVIFINGGNTFYLLDWVRKSGLDKYLGELVNNGKIYVGVSAGSILAGPNIELAGWDIDWDKNISGLKDLAGLNLVPFAISPHFVEADRHVLTVEPKAPYRIIPITDNQAILVKGNDWRVVGEGEEIKL